MPHASFSSQDAQTIAEAFNKTPPLKFNMTALEALTVAAAAIGSLRHPAFGRSEGATHMVADIVRTATVAVLKAFYPAEIAERMSAQEIGRIIPSQLLRDERINTIRVVFELLPFQVFLLISAIQAAFRSDQLRREAQSGTVAMLRAEAKTMQAALTEATGEPKVAEVLELGWNPENDVFVHVTLLPAQPAQKHWLN